MPIAGIAIDDWKLPTFKEALDGAGYLYTEHAGPVEGCTLLKVKYADADIGALSDLVKETDRKTAN